MAAKGSSVHGFPRFSTNYRWKEKLHKSMGTRNVIVAAQHRIMTQLLRGKTQRSGGVGVSLDERAERVAKRTQPLLIRLPVLGAAREDGLADLLGRRRAHGASRFVETETGGLEGRSSATSRSRMTVSLSATILS